MSSAGGWIWGGMSGFSLEVDRDTVLPAIRLILDEARRFTDFAVGQLPALRVSGPVDDPVCRCAAKAMNQALWDGPDSFYGRCWVYAEGLVELAETLAQAARTYGHTEEEIRAMFAGGQVADMDDAANEMRRRTGTPSDSHEI